MAVPKRANDLFTENGALEQRHPGPRIAFCTFSGTRFAAGSQFENPPRVIAKNKKGSEPFLLSAIGHGSTRKTRKKIVWPETVPCPSACFRGGVPKTGVKRGQSPFYFSKCNWPRKTRKTRKQKGVRALLLSAIGHGSTRKTRKKLSGRRRFRVLPRVSVAGFLDRLKGL